MIIFDTMTHEQAFRLAAEHPAFDAAERDDAARIADALRDGRGYRWLSSQGGWSGALSACMDAVIWLDDPASPYCWRADQSNRMKLGVSRNGG